MGRDECNPNTNGVYLQVNAEQTETETNRQYHFEGHGLLLVGTCDGGREGLGVGKKAGLAVVGNMVGAGVKVGLALGEQEGNPEGLKDGEEVVGIGVGRNVGGKVYPGTVG